MVDNLMKNLPQNATFAGKVSWTGYYEVAITTISFPFLPYIWQRMYMARSSAMVAKNLMSVPIIFVVLFFVCWVLGTSAVSVFPDGLEDPDSVFGAMFAVKAPFFGALVLVAAFAAGMSTVDSQVLGAGSLVTHDIKPLVGGRETQADADVYLFGRWSALFLLIALYVISLFLQKAGIVFLIILGVSLTVVFLPCVFGMFYWKQATSAGASWSLGVGLVVFLIRQFKLFGIGNWEFVQTLGPITWSLIAAIVVFVVVSLATSSARIAHKQQEYDEILGFRTPQVAD